MKLNEFFIEQYRMPFGSNLEIAKENTIRLLSSKIDEIIKFVKEKKA
jgi:hypothetical protein